MKKIIYSQSFIEFLENSKSKIAKILMAIYRKSKDTSILTSSEINYITFRTNGMISYLPAGKECIYLNTFDETWSRENRQEGRPSKVIKKIFTKRAIALLKLKDKDFEGFSNSYKATFNEENYTFTLLSKSCIDDIYDRERGEGGSSLNGSCMNDQGHYMEIYQNCDECKILILENEKKELVGRSLVWNLPEITLMDRIYVAQDHLYDLFLEHADKNDWWRKENYKTYNDKELFVLPGGESRRVEFKITTDTNFEYYPYIDTFSFGGDGFITNSESSSCSYVYDCTGGERTSTEEDNHNGEVWDEINDDYIDEEDSVIIDCGTYRGIYTHEDNTVMDVDGNRWWMDDNGIVEDNDSYFRKDSYIWSNYEDTYIKRDSSVNIDGKYYNEWGIPEDLITEEA